MTTKNQLEFQNFSLKPRIDDKKSIITQKIEKKNPYFLRKFDLVTLLQDGHKLFDGFPM